MAAWCRAWCRLHPARQHNKGINEGPRWRGGAGLSCAMCPRSGDTAPLPVISVLISPAAVPVPISGDTVPSPHPATGLGWAGRADDEMQPAAARVSPVYLHRQPSTSTSSNPSAGKQNSPRLLFIAHPHTEPATVT